MWPPENRRMASSAAAQRQYVEVFGGHSRSVLSTDPIGPHRQRLSLQGRQVEALGCMVDVKADNVPVGIKIDVESRGYFGVSAPGPDLNST